MIRIVVLGVVLVLALPACTAEPTQEPPFQVDYDSIHGEIRTYREDIREVFPSDFVPNMLFTWTDDSVTDEFTGETWLYVKGWGEREVLFMVASCNDEVSIAFADRGLVFEDGLIDAIWDGGEIMQYEAQDLDGRLLLASPDWNERLRTHAELRVQVNVFEQSPVSDTFNLLPDARKVFYGIGCE